MPKPQRFCDFCGKPGLTREEIWAKWLQRILPKPEGYDGYHNWHLTGRGDLTVKGLQGDTIPYAVKNTKRTGHTRTRKLKNVCGDCNNGWMSRLQSAVKPRLEPIVHGGWRELGPGDQKILATWAVMFTMVLELAHEDTNAHTFEQRNEFALDPKPPRNWLIWIGNAREYPLDFWHYAWRFSPDPKTANASTKLNIQTTTFAVGETFFHAFSHSEPLFDGDQLNLFKPAQFALDHRVTWLWPINSYPLPRPPRYLTAVEIDAVAKSMVRLFGVYAIEPDGKEYIFEPRIIIHRDP